MTAAIMAAAARVYAQRLGWLVFPVHYPVFSGSGNVLCSCGKKRPHCDRLGKHPVTRHGCKDATRDLSQIAAWWREDANYNVGLATGSETGIFVLDVDVKAGGEESLEALEDKHGKLPSTVHVLTGGGGSHFYFKHPGWRVANTVSTLGSGLDIRGDGGYVVAPPALHESGKTYAYELSSRPTDIEVSLAPDWLLGLVREERKAKPPPKGPPRALDTSKMQPLERRIRRARAYAERFRAAVSGQGGHNALFEVSVAVVRGFAIPLDDAYKILIESYNPRCKPPWSDDDIARKVEQADAKSSAVLGYLMADDEGDVRALPAARPMPEPPPGRFADDPPAPALTDDASQGDMPPELYARMFGEMPEERGGAPLPPDPSLSRGGEARGPAPEGDDAPGPAAAAEGPPEGPAGPQAPTGPAGPPPDDGGDHPGFGEEFVRGDHVELAERLESILRERHPILFDDGDVWSYDEKLGRWSRCTVSSLAREITNFAGTICLGAKTPFALKLKASDLSGVVKVLHALLENDPANLRFEGAARGVAFSDCFVRVRNGRIERLAHSPDHLCRYGFDFPYDPKAAQSRLHAFLDSVFSDKSEEDAAASIMLLQEFIGTCLIGEAPRYQKCLILTGQTGANGKSQMLDIVEGAFSHHGHIASIRPQIWGEKFQMFGLLDALINVVHEIPEDDITAGQAFKGVVSGDYQHLDRKNRDPVRFRPVAGHLFSANELPGTVDQTGGFWRRFVVIEFARNFEHSSEKVVDIGKLIVSHERAGILAWALEGAARAQQQIGYTIPGSSHELLQHWRDDTDPIRAYLLDSRNTRDLLRHFADELSTESVWASASAVYGSYATWAKMHGHMTMSMTRFGRRVGMCGLFDRRRTKYGKEYRPTAALFEHLLSSDEQNRRKHSFNAN